GAWSSGGGASRWRRPHPVVPAPHSAAVLAPIPIENLRKVGVGLRRPEDVVVGGDGRVWASDQASACAEILSDGTLRRVGKAGGAPNGINMDTRGRILIANFGLGTAPTGPLQRLDPATGELEVLCDAIDGKPLVASNYPIVDRAGNVWCSHSTWDRARSEQGLADGPVLGEPAFPGATPAERARFGATDGCGFDADGNLWVTLVLANKVIAITPKREVVTVIHDPTGELMSWPTNVSWGGPDMRDLYIGTIRRDYVLHARSPVPGLPLVHQR